MTRSPSRAVHHARSAQTRSVLALLAVPFVLVGLVASKLARTSVRRRVAAEPVPPPVPAPTYRVELGDTVSEIAIRHGLPTAHVLAQNGLSWKTPIFPGQLIRLAPVSEEPEPADAPEQESDERAE
jgi:LysM repeat protein